MVRRRLPGTGLAGSNGVPAPARGFPVGGQGCGARPPRMAPMGVAARTKGSGVRAALSLGRLYSPSADTSAGVSRAVCPAFRDWTHAGQAAAGRLVARPGRRLAAAETAEVHLGGCVRMPPWGETRGRTARLRHRRSTAAGPRARGRRRVRHEEAAGAAARGRLLAAGPARVASPRAMDAPPRPPQRPRGLPPGRASTEGVAAVSPRLCWIVEQAVAGWQWIPWVVRAALADGREAVAERRAPRRADTCAAWSARLAAAGA
jgi:hypothetical protein